MKITTEIKVKMFAKYLGERVVTRLGYNKMTVSMLNIVNGGGCDELKLILKPISQISDEDSNKIANISGFDYRIEDKQFELAGALMCDSYTFSEVHSYLESKGYDLPQFLLGGKTLQESRLAEYENIK
jgi:hypothetical protein